MKLNQLFSLGLMTAGAAATILPLQRRVIWDNANRTVAIALDYDDTVEAAARAGAALDDLLHQLWHAGATHLTIPEDTLARLMAQGRVAVAIPAAPLADRPKVGRWTYLAANDHDLLARVQAEIDARQPAIDTVLADEGDRAVLAISGDFATLQQIGLGFDPQVVHTAEHAGLQPLPRPVSYPWPTAATIERTLAQAAQIAQPGSNTRAMVAFQGDGAPGHPGELILGHEMLMHETIGAMQRHGLTFAYFAESRHQRGDWFVAKSLAPNVVLAHEFTQPQLVTEDMFSAAHRWGLLARERGIRLAVLQLFKVVHATTPRDCVDYVGAVADVLVNREGLRLSGRPDFRPAPIHHSHDHGHGHTHDHGEWGVGSGGWGAENHELGEQHAHDHQHNDEPHHHDHGDQHHHHDSDESEIIGSQPPAPNPQPPGPTLARDYDALPWIALIPAGAGALALSEFLDLPQKLSVPLTLAGLLAPLAVRRLDRPANDLEATFRPSYAPKLVALGITASAPLAASLVSYRGGLATVLASELITGLAAAGLAATVADRDYALRVEEVKTWQLDWIVPLAGALAVALTPALAARRRPLQVEIVQTAAVPVMIAPAAPPEPPAQRLATALPAPIRDKGKALALRYALQLADVAMTSGTRRGESLLRNRLSGPTGALTLWAFRQGSTLARRRLVQPALQRALTPVAAPPGPESQEAEPPVERIIVRSEPVQPVAAASGEVALRAGIMLAVTGAGLVVAKSGLLARDPLAALDLEHTAEHTHHLSRAQAAIGDARMAVSPRPLRKWTLPTVVALAVAATAPGRAAEVALVAATLGGSAFLSGFRQTARPLARTVAGRVTLPGTRRRTD